VTPAATGMAVVGSSGHAARVAAPTIAGTAGARLVGVLGSTPERGERLARHYDGCAAYSTWEELGADPAVEAVWIAGPNDSHAQFARNCLRAGKHVLLEKPMATTHRDADDLARLASETGLTLGVGFQHRFRPAHEWLRDAVLGGLVGPVRLARIHRFWPYPYYADMPPDPSQSWRTSLEQSGGWVLTDIGSHLVDLALWILGERASVAYARTANVKFHDAAAEDTAIVLLETEAGAVVTVEVSNAMTSFPGTIELHGLAGWIRADGTFDGGGSVVTHAGDRLSFRDVSAMEVYAASLRDFLRALAGEPSRGATASEGAEAVAIVERAARRPGARTVPRPAREAAAPTTRE
jgi:predicted dehydrogenase